MLYWQMPIRGNNLKVSAMDAGRHTTTRGIAQPVKLALPQEDLQDYQSTRVRVKVKSGGNKVIPIGQLRRNGKGCIPDQARRNGTAGGQTRTIHITNPGNQQT